MASTLRETQYLISDYGRGRVGYDAIEARRDSLQQRKAAYEDEYRTAGKDRRQDLSGEFSQIDRSLQLLERARRATQRAESSGLTPGQEFDRASRMQSKADADARRNAKAQAPGAKRPVTKVEARVDGRLYTGRVETTGAGRRLAIAVGTPASRSERSGRVEGDFLARQPGMVDRSARFVPGPLTRASIENVTGVSRAPLLDESTVTLKEPGLFTRGERERSFRFMVETDAQAQLLGVPVKGPVQASQRIMVPSRSEERIAGLDTKAAGAIRGGRADQYFTVQADATTRAGKQIYSLGESLDAFNERYSKGDGQIRLRPGSLRPVSDAVKGTGLLFASALGTPKRVIDSPVRAGIPVVTGVALGVVGAGARGLSTVGNLGLRTFGKGYQVAEVAASAGAIALYTKDTYGAFGRARTFEQRRDVLSQNVIDTGGVLGGYFAGAKGAERVFGAATRYVPKSMVRFRSVRGRGQRSIYRDAYARDRDVYDAFERLDKSKPRAPRELLGGANEVRFDPDIILGQRKPGRRTVELFDTKTGDTIEVTFNVGRTGGGRRGSLTLEPPISTRRIRPPREDLLPPVEETLIRSARRSREAPRDAIPDRLSIPDVARASRSRPWLRGFVGLGVFSSGRVAWDQSLLPATRSALRPVVDVIPDVSLRQAQWQGTAEATTRLSEPRFDVFRSIIPAAAAGSFFEDFFGDGGPRPERPRIPGFLGGAPLAAGFSRRREGRGGAFRVPNVPKPSLAVLDYGVKGVDIRKLPFLTGFEFRGV